MKQIFIIIWFGLLVEIALIALIKPSIIDSEVVSLIAVSLHAVFTLLIILSHKSDFKIIFFWAYIARVSFMFWDVYASHIYSLPNSGYDSRMFFSNALQVSEDMSLLSEGIRGGYYSKLNGILFYLIGPQQMFGQYLNVLLGLTVIFILCKILLMLEIKTGIIKIILITAALLPNSLIMSAIFLREMVVTFFVTCSLYFFIMWFKDRLYWNIIFAITMLGFASMFHSGISVIFFGYAFVFLFHSRGENIFRLRSKSVYNLIFLFSIAFIAVALFGDIILSDFKKPDGSIDAFSIEEYEYGESEYLADMIIGNPVQFIIYGPIRAFYFLTSPLPMNWRGLMDIFTFLYDSLIYLGTIIYFILNRKKLNDRRVLAFGLVMVLISVSLVFGIGVSNAGSAVRHRHKILPIIMVLLAVMMDGRRRTTKPLEIIENQASVLN